jgi:chitodextrinase
MKKETAQSECPPKVHGSKCQNTGKWYAGSTFKNGDTDTWIHLSEHTALQAIRERKGK